MSDERRNALKPGMEFEGYRIEETLGAGGFGITYRATETLIGREVAIKEFVPAGMVVRESNGATLAPIGSNEAADFEWGMERFRSEARTLVSFRHPNIVTVFRYFETNGTGYLVMEYVEGRTLAQLLHPDKTLSGDEIREILPPLLDGLEAVHEKGFLHRDVKPANIFIRADGTPILIDFGAARHALGGHSQTLTSIVSAGYAPYEQYDSGASQGPWTDIYALGGVLHRCITGKVPAEAPARVTALVTRKDDPLKTLEPPPDGYDPDLVAAIAGALKIRETDRPQTIAKFRQLLGDTVTPDQKESDSASGDSDADADNTVALPTPTTVTPKSPVGASTLLAGSISAYADPKPASELKASGAETPSSKAAKPVAEIGPTPPKADQPVPGPKRQGLADKAGRSPTAPQRKPVNWKIAGPAAAAILIGATGVWAVVASGESEACSRIAAQGKSALRSKNLTELTSVIIRADVEPCSASRRDGLRKDLAALKAELARAEEGRKALQRQREAARKRREEEAARRRAAEAEAARKRVEAAAAERLEKDKKQCHSSTNAAAVAACTRVISSGKVRGISLSLYYYNRGVHHGISNNYEAALRDYNRAISLNANEHRAYLNRSVIFIKRRNYNQALADLNSAIRIKSDYGLAYRNRGYVNRRLRRFNAAIRDYTQAIRLNANDVSAYTGRGIAYGVTRNNRAALSDFQAAARLRPNSAPVWNNMGVAYAKLGRRYDAIRAYRRALQLRPGYPPAIRNLRRLGAY